MSAWVMKVLNGSLSVTRTVTDTTVLDVTSPGARIGVDSSGNARIVIYSKFSNPSTGQLASTTQQQYIPVAGVYSCTTAASTFTELGQIVGAKEASAPFYVANSARFYVGLVAWNGGTNQSGALINRVGTSYLADITESVVSTTPKRFRPSAILGEYVSDVSYLHSDDNAGFHIDGVSCPYRPFVSGYDVSMGFGSISTYGIRSYTQASLRLYDPTKCSFATDAISGGILAAYDGYQPIEAGIVTQPILYAVDLGTGSLPTGSYVYTAVYSYRDRQGRVYYSRCAEPTTVVMSANVGKGGIDVTVPTVTAYDGPISILLFRTAVGATQFYLVEERAVNTPTTTVLTQAVETFTDTMLDAVLIAKPLLFRAPGTASTALDRCNAVSASQVIRHKDRVFYSHDSTVFYSSFDVQGEAPWFSPGLSFDVLGGTGPITGLASMDGALLVFKRDAIFLVDGDGPPENGGSGNEYSPPRRIQNEFGCLDQRSICSIPDGITFRSHRGLEILNRGLKVVWLGERVQATVNSYPYTGGCTFDRVNGRLYYVLGATQATDLGNDYTANGCTVVFDTINNVWSKFFHTNTSAYGKAMQDVVFANASSGSNTTDTVYFADHNNGLFYESDTSGLDALGSFVPWKLATGWVRGQSKQDRVRISDFQFLGRQLTGHNLKCEYLVNWDRTSTATIATKDATATAIIPEQIEFQPPREKLESAKFVLSSVTPTNPTTLGVGTQCEINGITVRLGPITGGFKVATTAKG